MLNKSIKILQIKIMRMNKASNLIVIAIAMNLLMMMLMMILENNKLTVNNHPDNFILLNVEKNIFFITILIIKSFLV